MSFLSVAHTDVGIRKNINQDSLLIKQAETDYGEVLLAVVCDGMGGLAKGEVASAALIRAFAEWFDQDLPQLLYEDSEAGVMDYNALQRSWNALLDSVNRKIAIYGESCHAACGTTVSALLLTAQHYYIVNIGDSRVYCFREEGRALTKDQTWVQREVDAGRMTPEEAERHPRKNVLLQCVGASPVIAPDFYTGRYDTGDVYLLCSDGFRHLISQSEFDKIFQTRKMQSESDMKDAAVYCTELNKQRKENDNISVILVKAA